jgi:hypothetical protein
MTDLINKIIEYENGDMKDSDVIDFFAELIKDGKAWSLQGCYGRMAKRLIKDKFISEKGKVLKYPK